MSDLAREVELLTGRLREEQEERQKLHLELMKVKRRDRNDGVLMRQENFPIQGDIGPDRSPPTVIPRWLAEEAYKWYASKFGTYQTLERLGERGGFCRKELLLLLRREA